MSICRRCRQPIEETDCYCRHCGKSLKPRMGFWYDHGGVLLLTLCAGPFSLPFVWFSRKLSLLAKWLWTVGILLFSIYAVYSLFKVMILVKEAFAALLTL